MKAHPTPPTAALSETEWKIHLEAWLAMIAAASHFPVVYK